ncbi:hypothetical protein M8J76_004724 [Diaphorina citri]|nr:hypothetical protein M8J76_004724 [Diaphorina citri]
MSSDPCFYQQVLTLLKPRSQSVPDVLGGSHYKHLTSDHPPCIVALRYYNIVHYHVALMLVTRRRRRRRSRRNKKKKTKKEKKKKQEGEEEKETL